jgi:hypothetical protein
MIASLYCEFQRIEGNGRRPQNAAEKDGLDAFKKIIQDACFKDTSQSAVTAREERINISIFKIWR